MIDVREEVMTTGRSTSRRSAKNNAPARGTKPAKAGKTLAAAIAHARTVILPGAGHMMMAERPDELLAALQG